MTGITDGKYRIRLAADPSPLVGIDPDHRTQTAAVVTRGNNKIVYLFAFLYDGMMC